MEEATANKSMTVAAIDLGTNTFRLLVVKIIGPETSVLVKRNATVKLGQGLSATKSLAPATMTNALAVLAEFRTELDRYHIDRCRCCGSEALRKAVNAEEFLDLASEVVGVDIDVVSGREEAVLGCNGVLASLTETSSKFPLLITDVGGGSTELIYLRDYSAAPLVVSLPAGAVFFTELFDAGGLPAAFDIFSSKLREFLGECPGLSEKTSVVSTGGTATALAALNLSLDHYDGEKVHGHKLTRENIAKLSADLTNMPASIRDFLPGLEKGRGNILMAGLEIYQEILATIEVDGMIISDSGFLEGIMLSCLGHNSVSLL